MKTQVLNCFFALICLLGLFVSCNSEDRIDDSFDSKMDYVSTRSKKIELGTARCTIKDRIVTIEWSWPTGSDKPVGMLFTLFSDFYGSIYNFETFEGEMSGTEVFELPASFKISEGDRLWLQVEDAENPIPVIIHLENTGGEFSGQSSPKCKHEFTMRDTYVTLNFDLATGSIEGSIELSRPCRFIIVYSYYDINKKKTISDYRSQNIYDKKVKLYWNGSYIHSYYYTSDIKCELRLYDLTCKNYIPQSDDDLNASGSCTNFLKTEFSIPASAPNYYLSTPLEICKQ